MKIEYMNMVKTAKKYLSVKIRRRGKKSLEGPKIKPPFIALLFFELTKFH